MSSSSTNNYNQTTIQFKKEDVQVLSDDGLVLITSLRNNHSLQQDLMDYCINILKGNEEGLTGVTELPTEHTNFQKCFLDVPFQQFNPLFSNIICHSVMELAKQSCPILQQYQDNFKVAQLCYYTQRGKLGWHRDRISGLTPEEQLLINSPVVSMSLGSDSIFSYKLNTVNENGEICYDTAQKAAVDIQLKSGDILVFGATQRMFYHCVKKIIKSSSSENGGVTMRELEGGRINITFREGTYYPDNSSPNTGTLQ